MTLVGGTDFGRHRDPTVTCVLDISRKPWELVRFVSITKRSWDFHIGQIRPQLSGVHHSVADATGVGDALYERLPDCWGCVFVARSKGLKFSAPNRLTTSVGFIMANLAEQLRQRNIIVTCSAPGLEQQLLHFQVKVGKNGLLKYAGNK